MIIDGKNKYIGCKIYITTNYKQGFRKSVSIYKDSVFIKCMSYARYLVETEMNLNVPEGYEVDHIDGDKTNDVIENLQVISSDMNKLKEKYETEKFKIFVRLICPYCSKQFDIEQCNLNVKLRNSKYIACSRSCSGKLTNRSMQTDYPNTPYRLNYEYIIGSYYDLSEVKNIENILLTNGVKFIKRY